MNLSLPQVESDPDLHFTETGTGPTALLVHGTPSYSYEWRKIVPHLAPHFRLVLPDHLGFGESAQPTQANYTPEAHAARLIRFVKQRNLKDFHLALHDFGGPIGLAMARAMPERIRSISVMNTWAWSMLSIPAIRRGSRIMNSFMGKFLYQRLHFSANVFLKKSFHDPKNLTPEIFQNYAKVHNTPEKRLILYALARSMRDSDAFFQSLWDERAFLTNIPLQIVWGMSDPFLPAKDFLQVREKAFPEAEVVRLEKSGHFPQEEEPEALAEAYKRHWSKS